MGITTAVLVGVDVWLAVSGRKTYSQVIRNAAREYPIVALTVCFALGVLAGHWFW